MTQTEGMYHLTGADLMQAGLSPLVLDPATMAMSYLGKPIDIQIIGASDGSFDPGDQIIFYAEPYQGRYQTSNVYWLTLGDGSGPAMLPRPYTPTGEEFPVTTITRTLHIEFNRDYRSAYHRPRDADHWFDAPLIASGATPTSTITYTLPIENPAPLGSLSLRVLLHGGVSQAVVPDQSVQIRLNEHAIGRYQWQGSEDYLLQATIPAVWLDQTPNRIELQASLTQLPSLSHYWVSPDWLELDYPGLAVAHDDRLLVDGVPAAPLELVATGFQEANIRAYEISDPFHPAFLTATQVISTPTAGFTLHLWDDATPDSRYLLTTDSALRSPQAILLDTPSAWHTPQHDADYIAITHHSLADAIDPLLAYHRAEGFRVVKVDVQDIYDEFNFGRRHPQAIRSFLSYAYHDWNHGGAPPQYVLLVGDGHYDFRGDSGTTLPNLIPPYLIDVDPWLGETAADNRYVSIDSPDDYLPDMSIGRIPARTPEELTAVVDKILAYEAASPGDWQKRVVFAADASSGFDADFIAISERVRSRILWPAYEAHTLYYGRDYATGVAMRTAFKRVFDQGALILQWFGHASRFRWGSVSMFNIFDPPTLRPHAELPVTFTYACWSGYFINLYRDYQSLGETLLLTPGRGAVAAFSPAGLHVGDDLTLLNQGIALALFQQEAVRLGPAIDAGK
ncbi:MAG: hypothetical protein GXP37_01060, partial [Chloroflexi bacterium]|nr:hypothetical protein [Chloroflexota bacterium]